MSLYTRKLRIFDKNLISGSSDSLRTALGGSWQVVSSSERGSEYTLESVYRAEPISPGHDTKIVPVEMYPNPYITYVLRFDHEQNIIRSQHYASKVVQPIIKYPIRIYGNNKLIKNDKHWQAIWAGGNFNNQVYGALYSGEEYYDHWFDYSLPYEALQLRESNIENKDSFSNIEIGYEYNYYYKEYEEYLSTLDNELLIPNAYILQTVSSIDDVYLGDEARPAVSLEDYSYSQCQPDILNYINRESVWPTSTTLQFLKTVKDYHNMMAAKPTEFSYMGESQVLKHYYNTLDVAPLNDKTEAYVTQKLKNIIFDHNSLQKEFLEILDNKKALPMYTKVKLPPQGSGPITDSVINNDASAKFLLTLKDLFVDKSAALQTTTTSFSVQETQNLNPNKESNEFYNADIKLVDMGKLLFHMRENYLNTSDDFYCVGNMNEPTKRALYDKDGFFRHLNTIAMTYALTEYLDYVDDDIYLEKIKSPYFESVRESSFAETMAYRVEKIGGPATGDGQSQNVLQNFYLMNAHDIHRAEILDTQVKYGEEYTYKIYAYVLVNGSRYQASDLRITKVISDLTVETMNPLYCLEFYDPFTEERKDKLIDIMRPGAPPAKRPSLAARALENEFATDAQVASEHYKYLADLNIAIQPSLKLLEIPVATKTVRVLDHPTSPAYALPFPVDDDSSRIGFEIEHRAFEKLPYPAVLTEEEEKNKGDYLASNSFTETTELERESASIARYLEIYRLDHKPTSYKEFEGKRVSLLDLANYKAMAEYLPDFHHWAPEGALESVLAMAPRQPAIRGGPGGPKIVLKDISVASEALFYDKIQPNKKYYYTMRFLNEREEPGYFSPVYQAELVSDGGYMYPIFDTIYPHDLVPDVAINTTKEFKKLVNLVPNIQQLLLNTDGVDYSRPSYSQKEKIKVGLAEDPIWDKTFKIRLTSKKTGKKIDLNITYKLSRG